MKIWNQCCLLSQFWKKNQSKTDIGKLWTQRLLIEFRLINLSCLLLKIWLKEKYWILLKTFNKLANQQKNRKKLKLLWHKSINSGNQESLTLLHGVRDKTPSWRVSVSKILLKDFKRIRWHWVQSMHKDMSCLSKKELNNWLEGSQTLHRPLICGLKYKNYGPA